jgi:trans-aconitate 2-methyltransferase
MTEKEEVKQFYDDFVGHQLEYSFNERHLLLFRELRKLGLSAKSTVLELGCGIGVMTSLIAKLANRGLIEAVDISRGSIGEAKKRIKLQQNVRFVVADLKQYESGSPEFDIITLLDVLEHIPQEDHACLFVKISNLMHRDSVFFISIPTPHSIVYEKLHFPENVQIIDQELSADLLISRAYQAGLELEFFRTIGIWAANDYQLLAFRKKIDYTNDRISNRRNLFWKVFHKMVLRKERFLLSRNYRMH